MPAYKHKTKHREVDPESLRRKLKLKHFEVKQKLSKDFPKAHAFFEIKSFDPGKVREHSVKLLTAGVMAGALFLTPGSNIKFLPPPHAVVDRLKDAKEEGKQIENSDFVVSTLKSLLPQRPRPLERDEEKFLEQIFQNIIGVPARATLEGERLNTAYGYIGAEQHLRRFPGDALLQHGEGEILNEGMAPGLGAWGYFANSKEELTPELEEIERWYAVVQTLYLPDWNTRTKYLKEWYKYRKVLIINTENGRAVVGAIADSGPAAWTGKHFGGSPEVMHYLGGSRYKKGPVLLFFVDDPENKVPLGPVEYSNSI